MSINGIPSIFQYKYIQTHIETGKYLRFYLNKYFHPYVHAFKVSFYRYLPTRFGTQLTHMLCSFERGRENAKSTATLAFGLAFPFAETAQTAGYVSAACPIRENVSGKIMRPSRGRDRQRPRGGVRPENI